MQADLEEILLLQSEYSSTNTPEMQRRGQLVRHVLADQVRDRLATLTAESGIEDLAVQGSDGVGRKTQLPWLRVYSEADSPNPRTGWYVVYLFAAEGDRVYLSVNQGTTEWNGAEFKPKPEGQLLDRVEWARESLHVHYPVGWTEEIQLGGSSKLGVSYEIGNVVAAEYELDSIPDDEQLERDLVAAVRILALLYEAESAGIPVAGETPPEVVDAQLAAEVTAGNLKPTAAGQGFRLSVADKRAIETHAVNVTTAYLQDIGFTVQDVGATESYDLHATMPGQTIKIEVKGTTSLGQEVILTRNEVLLHQDAFPDNALAVVHSIQLDRSTDPPTASGGKLDYEDAWSIHEEDLTPISYRYVTGIAADD